MVIKLKFIFLILLGLLPVHIMAQQGAVLIANFNPGAATLDALPFPNNLLFSGSMDGTLNVPLSPDPSDPANVTLRALNELDGFSTVAPVLATFSNGANSRNSSGIDPATVIAGESVRFFEVQLVNPFLNPAANNPFAVENIQRELIPNVDFVARLSPTDPTGKTMVILPLHPLKPKTGYMVVLTNAIRALDSTPVVADQTYQFARYRGNHHRPIINQFGQSNFPQLSDAQAQQLARLQPLVLSQERAAASYGVERGSLVVSWTFLTQSIGDALATISADTGPTPSRLAPAGAITPLGLADVYSGAMEVSYYLEAPLAPSEGPVILSTQWRGGNDGPLTRYNPTPVPPQPEITIPMLVTVPSLISGFTQPATGWPVAIFQHGLSENRANLLAIADSLARVGMVGVAIDLPLHGITDVNDPFYADTLERTFNVDLVDNITLQAPPDGQIDPSGIHYINLSSPLTMRDNLRQAAADLVQLTTLVTTLDLDGDGSADLDPDQIEYIGHSLGAIVGVPFLAVESRVGAATLANPGGGLAQLLVNSATLGPIIRTGLAQVGVVPGTTLYDFFVLATQTVIDPGDPINYANQAAEDHPIHMLSVVGGAGNPPSLPDQVVPNRVVGAPLSGTAPLARVMGLTPIAESTTDPQGVRGIVRFTSGSHRSFLDPRVAPAVTIEMQRETINFLISNGIRLPIYNPNVVQIGVSDVGE